MSTVTVFIIEKSRLTIGIFIKVKTDDSEFFI
jgi:hypothetical protein